MQAVSSAVSPYDCGAKSAEEKGLATTVTTCLNIQSRSVDPCSSL